jgi:hypothetical protein
MRTPQVHRLPDWSVLSLRFLHTELETGLVFAQIALTASDEDAIRLTRENARKAYRSARHFMTRIPLSMEDSAELCEKLQELKLRLRSLDEEP